MNNGPDVFVKYSTIERHGLLPMRKGEEVMKMFRQLLQVWVFLVVSIGIVHAEDPKFPGVPGKLEPAVASLSDAEMTYALYLPEDYSTDRLWPVLVCLDPAARGTVPVERFKEAADFHGFILIGSNHARNYDAKSVERSLTAILGDLGQRYPVHADGVYATGFSGGARVALTLASQFGHFSGVIACGAGFHPEYPPDPFVRFPILMTLGLADSNYCFMRSQYRMLQKYGRDVSMLLFDGGHDWPSVEMCHWALGWLRLRGQDRGVMPVDAEWRSLFMKALADRAEEHLAAGRPVEAMCALDMMNESQVQRSGISDRIRDLRQQAMGHPLFMAEREQVVIETDKMKEIESVMVHCKQQGLDIQERSGMRQWVRTKAAAYRRMSKDPDPGKRMMGTRLLDFLWRRPFEGIMIEMAKGAYENAIRLGELAAIVQPDNWVTDYNMACAYARKDDLRNAMKSLEKAVEKGLRNPRNAWADADLADLMNNPKYQEKLGKLLGPRP